MQYTFFYIENKTGD